MVTGHIPQLRISVTSACDKRCLYCRPGGEGFSSTRTELTSAELVHLTSLLVDHGITDLKLTGGEPMLRHDIVDIVATLKAMSGVKNVHLVTRHPRAGECAQALKEAGLDCLNFSLDSLDAETWAKITRSRGHDDLMNAILKAADTGIHIKINTVVLKGINDHEIQHFVDFAGRIGATLKLLDLIVDVPFYSEGAGLEADHYFDLATLLPVFKSQAVEAEIDLDYQPGGLGHPMPRFLMRNGATVWVKTSRMGACYGDVCTTCAHRPCHDAIMALRLTADGKLQRCLLRQDNLVDLASLVRDNATAEEIGTAIEQILADYRTIKLYDYSQLQTMRNAKTDRLTQPEPA